MLEPRNTFNVAMIQLKPMTLKKFHSKKSSKKKIKGSLKRTSSVLWDMLNNYTKHDDLAYTIYNDISKKLFIYNFENLVKKLGVIKSSGLSFMSDIDTKHRNILTNSTQNILTKDVFKKEYDTHTTLDESVNEKVQSFIDIDYLKFLENDDENNEILENDLDQQSEDELEYQVLDDEIHNESDILKLSEEKYRELFDIDDEMSWMQYIFTGQWFTDAVNSIDLKLLTSLKVFYEVFSGRCDLYTLYSAYKVATSSVDWETFFAREIRAAKVTAAEMCLFILLLIIKNLSSILKKTPETDIISMTGKFIIPMSLIANVVTTPFSLDTSLISSTNPSQLLDVMPSQIMIPNPNNMEIIEKMKNFEKVQPLYIKALSNGFPQQNVELEELKNQLIKLGQSKGTPLVYTPNENSLVNFKQQNFIDNYRMMMSTKLPYGSDKRFKKINLDELNKGTRPLALIPEQIKLPEPEIAENVPTRGGFVNMKRINRQNPDVVPTILPKSNPSSIIKSHKTDINFSEIKNVSTEIESFPRTNLPIENSDSIKDTDLPSTKINKLGKKEFVLGKPLIFNKLHSNYNDIAHNSYARKNYSIYRNYGDDDDEYYHRLYNKQVKPPENNTTIDTIDKMDTLKRPFSSLTRAHMFNVDAVNEQVGFNLSAPSKQSTITKQIPQTNISDIHNNDNDTTNYYYIKQPDKIGIFLKFSRKHDPEIIKTDVLRNLFIRRKTTKEDFRVLVNKVLKNQFADDKTLFTKNLNFYNELAQIRNNNMDEKINLFDLVDDKLEFNSNLKPNEFVRNKKSEMKWTEEFPWFRAINIADLNMLEELEKVYTPELFRTLYDGHDLIINMNYAFFKYLINRKRVSLKN